MSPMNSENCTIRLENTTCQNGPTRGKLAELKVAEMPLLPQISSRKHLRVCSRKKQARAVSQRYGRHPQTRTKRVDAASNPVPTPTLRANWMTTRASQHAHAAKHTGPLLSNTHVTSVGSSHPCATIVRAMSKSKTASAIAAAASASQFPSGPIPSTLRDAIGIIRHPNEFASSVE